MTTQVHWGLETESLDREPKRNIRVSKTSASRVPKLLLWEAVLRYDHLIGNKKITELRFLEIQHRRTLHLGNIHVPGGRSRANVQSIHEMLQACMGHTLRRSDYEVNVLSNYLTDVLIEFTASRNARKASTRMIEIFGEHEDSSERSSSARLTGRTRWIRFKSFRCWLQWWGTDSYWATEQMNSREDAREKFLAGDQEPTSSLTNGDAWDDDEEEEKKKREKISRTKKEEDEEDTKELNVWDALLSSSDDDDGDDGNKDEKESWESRVHDEEASMKNDEEASMKNDESKKDEKSSLYQCKECTYINPIGSVRCEMCEAILSKDDWSTA